MVASGFVMFMHLAILEQFILVLIYLVIPKNTESFAK
jgi:hypothetical protein